MRFEFGRTLWRLQNHFRPKFMTSTRSIITVTPERGLVDDPLDVKIGGLKPGQKVTLQTFLEDSFKYISCAHYVADSGGNVKVSEQASLGGSYQGIESAGLLWSMVPAPGQRDGLRLIKMDATVPYNVRLFVHDGHHDLEQCYDMMLSGLHQEATTFYRTYKDDQVTRIPVREGRVRGALYTPPGPGPFPVVVDIFGAAGGLLEFRAALLASRGFQTLALAYFNYEDLPKYPTKMNLDYFEEAVEFVSNLPNANKKGVGMIGSSAGAIITLALSEFVPKLKAVVSINGSFFRNLVTAYYKSKHLPSSNLNYAGAEMIDNAFVFRGCYENVTVDEECRIKFEKSNAEFLFIASGDDSQVPPSDSERCVERLRQFGKSNYEHFCYEGAGHLLEPPHSPFCRLSYNSVFGCNFMWGGEMVKHMRAQEDHWKRVLHFLNKHIKL